MNDLRTVLLPLRQLGRPALLLVVVLLTTYGYFVGAAAWNQNSRLALTRAWIEHGTSIIDPYHDTTGDKSYRDGHYYSDKAPGASLLAVVPYAVFYAARVATRGDLPKPVVIPLDPIDLAAGRAPAPADRKPGDRLVYNGAHRVALYLATLFACAIPAVMAAMAFYLLALPRLDGNHRDATIVTLALALATPMFPYSTALYGHVPCAAFMFVAFALVVLLPRPTTSPLGALVCGSLLGLAVVCEYPGAMGAVLLVGFAAHWRDLRFAAWMCVGGLPWALVLAGYHTIAFGSPFATGYDFVALPQFAEGMRVRYGIHPPDAQVAMALLFGSYRGLFYVAPVCLLAMWGLIMWLWRGTALPGGGPRALAGVALAIFASQLALNAGYYMWDGGASFGPRHMIPAIPMLALGLLPVMRVAPRALVTVAGISGVHMLLAAAASPEAPEHGNPLWEYAWPQLLARAPVTDAGATNIGALLGLAGPASLLPLIALWVVVWPQLRGVATAIRSDR